MAWFNFNKNEKKDIIVESGGSDYQMFSTPFGVVGKGNLSLPYVRGFGSETWVRFGSDNLYPQLINQMYQQSPLNGSIIKFKRNATVGGGWDITGDGLTPKDKVEQYSFIKKYDLKKLVHQTTLDLILHERIILLIYVKNGIIRSIKRVGPEKVRNNEDSTMFTICDDWSRNSNLRTYKAYCDGIEGYSIYEYSYAKGEAGQEIYPIPSYCSALNSAYLNGEIPFLQKSNLINSIFPSFMLTMAKKFASNEEAEQFKQQIEKAKGAQEAGRILAFVSNSAENLPTLTPIPKNENDKLFTETIDEVKASICTAHNIDMLIMGIRVPGKLGSGNELPMAYAIFEKNVIMPLREQMEDFINDLLVMNNIPGEFKIREYKIIDNEIK